MSMQRKVSVAAIRLLLIISVLVVPAQAQTYTLSGTVSDSAGHAVPSATVLAKSVATGKSFTAKTNADGIYSIRDLAGGDYEVSALAGELQAPPIKVTLAAAQTTDLTVSPAPRSPGRRKGSSEEQHPHSF
jgi:hypothetical protein